MAVAMGKIFGMFDKVDDLIYEPIKLVADILRQPLKQIDVNNEKKKMGNEQELKKDLAKFEADLELRKEEREMQLSVERRRMEEEINQMILDHDLQRREDMVRLEMRYRSEMAEAATRLAQIMGDMQVETRSKIFILYKEKTNDYLESQQTFEDSLLDKVERMKKLFPGEKGEEKIMDYYFQQLNDIAQRSTDFANSMNADMKKVLGIIDDGMKEITGLATKYFKPAEPNQPALTQNVVNSIESSE